MCKNNANLMGEISTLQFLIYIRICLAGWRGVNNVYDGSLMKLYLNFIYILLYNFILFTPRQTNWTYTYTLKGPELSH